MLLVVHSQQHSRSDCHYTTNRTKMLRLDLISQNSSTLVRLQRTRNDTTWARWIQIWKFLNNNLPTSTLATNWAQARTETRTPTGEDREEKSIPPYNHLSQSAVRNRRRSLLSLLWMAGINNNIHHNLSRPKNGPTSSCGHTIWMNRWTQPKTPSNPRQTTIKI